MNNISSGGRGNKAMSSVDFYRRVPRDLTEATSLGALMSVLAISIMGILFFAETFAFLSTKITTSIAIDENTQPQIRLNFNITMHDIHCDYVSVDVWDALGTNRQNVTKNVDKWQLDDDGTKRIFSGRNRDPRDLRHEEHSETHEEMTQDGEMAVDLDETNFDAFLEKNPMAFIDFFAPWCIWCQRLAPTWEKFARKVMQQDHMPVGVGKVDCMAQANLCRKQKVMAFPTLRWYHDKEPATPDYKMDRTLDALSTFAERKLQMDERFKEWQVRAKSEGTAEDEVERKRKLYRQHRPDHPACMASGFLMVNRVPGNFHIEANSKSHNLNAAMTNLSHTVNHLSFGEPLDKHNRKFRRIVKQVPEEHKQFSPMDDSNWVTKSYHQAFHHYIKVVSTHLNMGKSKSDDTSLMAYQFLEQSQIVFYDESAVPEARFSYDLSPMSVVVEKRARKWYDYLTSLCAIIGGTFTTLGLIDATLYRVFKPKKL